MRTYWGIEELTAPLGPSVVTMGNFDGVHLGHRALIARGKSLAQKKGIPLTVFTFSPHPVKILRPEVGLRELFDESDLEEVLQPLGVQILLIEPFTLAFAAHTPQDFVERYLVSALGAKDIVIGHDFKFGVGRTGTAKLLEEMAPQYGFEVHVCHPIQAEGDIISSSRIRRAIEQGDVELAARLLGRPYYLQGQVVTGEARGAKIGFPTANLKVASEILPAKGVYISRTRIDSKFHPSVTNVGVNPTFAGSGEIKVETHVLNEVGSLYGQSLRIEFLRHVRGEKKFADLEALKKQIGNDVAAARKHFGGEL